ncbi:MAG: hypothetical protein EOO47_22335, partial [Flavobacterium sp.]
MKISKLLVIILIFLFRTPSLAQEQGLNKIFKLLQESTDTSFLIHNYNTHELQFPTFKILSRINSEISLYRYSNDKTTNAKVIDPFDIDASKLLKLKNISVEDKELLWKKMSAINPWDIKDDNIEGEGCPNKYVYHQAGISLYLITKGKIKKLSFYAPHYFQRVCKKRAGRQSIIKLEKLFN